MRLHGEKERDVSKRLNRIEGQIRGIQRMVTEGRYCGDVLQQIASAQQALRSVGEVIARNHLETCVTDALRSGDREAAERTYDEVMSLLFKQLR
jgi:CsoR family transcriptional regulator, copper-sensing transcriptional repressor